MEKRFKSLSLFEFQERFPNDDKCKEYLAEPKWSFAGGRHKYQSIFPAFVGS